MQYCLTCVRPLHVGRMLAKSPAAVLQALKKYNATVAIIGKKQNITDLPPYAFLKGMYTFDGRPYWTIRGVGAPDTRFTVSATAEENLLFLSSDPYVPWEVTIVHEFAHTVDNVGLADQVCVWCPLSLPLAPPFLRGRKQRNHGMIGSGKKIDAWDQRLAAMLRCKPPTFPILWKGPYPGSRLTSCLAAALILCRSLPPAEGLSSRVQCLQRDAEARGSGDPKARTALRLQQRR